MLLAYERGARLIVAVGTHSNLEDFLDKGRAGMASTFLVRLKVGARLVDARGFRSFTVAPPRGRGSRLVVSGGAVFAALVSNPRSRKAIWPSYGPGCGCDFIRGGDGRYFN